MFDAVSISCMNSVFILASRKDHKKQVYIEKKTSL